MFRELTDAELALLSDSEKEVYNKELLLYKERMAFVGQLERIEGADYQYRKPKFSGINQIPQIDVPQRDIAAPKKVAFPQELLDKMRKVVVSYSSFTPPSKIHLKGMPSHRGGAVRIMPTVMPIGKIRLAGIPKKSGSAIAKLPQIQPAGSVKVTGIPEKPDNAIAKLPQIQLESSAKVTGMPKKPDSSITKLHQIQPVVSVKVTGMPEKPDSAIVKLPQIQSVGSVRITGMPENSDSAIAQLPTIQPVGSVKITGMPEINIPATQSIDKEAVTDVIQRIITIMQGA